MHIGIVPFGTTAVRRKPSEVGHLIIVKISPEQQFPVLQDWTAPRERDRCAEKLEQVMVSRHRCPVETANFVVLTIGVIVTALGASQLVATEDHRCSRSEQEITGEVLHQLLAQSQNGGI